MSITVQKHGSQKRAQRRSLFQPSDRGRRADDRPEARQETIVTALLHDTVEDTLATIEEIEHAFGPEVARLVDGVTKLSKIELQSETSAQAENLRKFLSP